MVDATIYKHEPRTTNEQGGHNDKRTESKKDSEETYQGRADIGRMVCRNDFADSLQPAKRTRFD